MPAILAAPADQRFSCSIQLALFVAVLSTVQAFRLVGRVVAGVLHLENKVLLAVRAFVLIVHAGFVAFVRVFNLFLAVRALQVHINLRCRTFHSSGKAASGFPLIQALDIQTMPFLEAIALSVGEFAGYLAGLVVGRTFDLSPKKAQAIGEYLIIGLVVTAAVAVTVLYS